jgi:hypothetical protein
MGRFSTTAFAPLVARLLRGWTRDTITARKLFPLWERLGFHVTRAHFYQPVPELNKLSPTLWDKPSEAIGIDFRVEAQLALLRELAPYSHELDDVPFEKSTEGFYFHNGAFGGTDAHVLYAMIRNLRPSLVIEVGSGWSTLLSDRAITRNGSGRLRCIEPYPEPWLKGSFELVSARAQDLGVAAFEELKANDILFIDSSHVVKIGSDVNFLFLEVLPRLASGVVVHIHDIFLPWEMPRNWIFDQHLFWNEQYLLQAFLAFNREFEVLLANHLLHRLHEDKLKEAFPRSPWWGGGSFWMRRV